MNHPRNSPKDTECKVLLDFEGQTLAQVMMEVERLYLENVLTAAGGNKSAAAKLAGVSNTTLRDKLSRYTVQTRVTLS